MGGVQDIKRGYSKSTLSQYPDGGLGYQVTDLMYADCRGVYLRT